MINQICGHLVTAGKHYGLKQIFPKVNFPGVRAVLLDFGLCVLLSQRYSVEDTFSATTPISDLILRSQERN